MTDSAAQSQTLDDRSAIPQCLEALAKAAVLRQAFEPAVVMLAAASAWRQIHDVPIPLYDRVNSHQLLAAARSALSSAAFDAAWAVGGAMSLQHGVTATPAVRRGQRRTQLTPREREVARLVSQGLTNRGIAGELGIAPATAALHVEHVRGKLGFHTRSQIAAWVARGLSAALL